MQMMQIDRERALARAALAKINIGLIAAAGARRQGHGDAHAGDRSPAALGAGAVRLDSLEDRKPDADPNPRPRRARPDELVTPLGFKTALRRVPRALARLGGRDARYLAALAYLDAHERLGAVAGQNPSSSGGGGISDGGAASRCEIAALLRRIKAAINGRPWMPRGKGRGTPDRAVRSDAAAPLVVLKLQKPRPGVRAITAKALLDGIVLDGLTAKEVLERHGWSVQSAYVKRLNALFLEILEVMVAPVNYGAARRGD